MQTAKKPESGKAEVNGQDVDDFYVYLYDEEDNSN
jgi:hypothetical protein